VSELDVDRSFCHPLVRDLHASERVNSRTALIEPGKNPAYSSYARQQFVKVIGEGESLSRLQVGSCPAFHTVTIRPRGNSTLESLEGEFTYPPGGVPTVEHYNETDQPYVWTGDGGWFDINAGIPIATCARPLTTEDGSYSITVTPYDGELVGGEPTGYAGTGLTINFSIVDLDTDGDGPLAHPGHCQPLVSPATGVLLGSPQDTTPADLT